MQTKGVFKTGLDRWITFIRTKSLLIKVTSETERFAKIKYNMLAILYKREQAKLYEISCTDIEYKNCADELLVQLMNSKNENLSKGNQGKTRTENKSTEFVGVSYISRVDLYYAYITRMRVRCSLGYYKSDEEAALAYNLAAVAIYGNIARLNNISMENVSEEFRIKIQDKINKKFNIQVV